MATPSGWRRAMLEKYGYCCCCGKPNQTTMRTNFILFCRAAAGLPWGHSVGIASTSSRRSARARRSLRRRPAAGVALAKGTSNWLRPARPPRAAVQEKTHLASRCKAVPCGSSARNSTVRSTSGMRRSPATRTREASSRCDSASRSTRATPADGRSAHRCSSTRRARCRRGRPHGKAVEIARNGHLAQEDARARPASRVSAAGAGGSATSATGADAQPVIGRCHDASQRYRKCAPRTISGARGRTDRGPLAPAVAQARGRCGEIIERGCSWMALWPRGSTRG